MKRQIQTLFVALALVCVSAVAAFASTNPILDALKADGVKVEQMSDAALSEVRGTGLVYGLVDPSFTQGIREYHVTWTKFGSRNDYRSYNIVGYDQLPNAYLNIPGYSPNGLPIGGFGDVWMADMTSSPNAWNRQYAQTAEYHLKTFDKISETTGQFNGYGYTESVWNRPLSTFNW